MHWGHASSSNLVDWHEHDPAIFPNEFGVAFSGCAVTDSNNISGLGKDAILLYYTAFQEGSSSFPDLFRLNDPMTNKPHWVFWSADGFYYIGDFDGQSFTNISGKKQSSVTPLPYAAQTFFNSANRVISLSWLRTANYYSPYTGMMSLPKELTLQRSESGLILEQRFVREICSRLDTTARNTLTDRFDHVHIGGAFQLKFEIDRGIAPSDPDTAEVDILERKLMLDFRSRTCTIGNTVFRLPNKKQLDFDIFVDHGVIEILVDSGTIYAATEFYFASLTGNIRMIASSGNIFRNIEINDFVRNKDSGEDSGI